MSFNDPGFSMLAFIYRYNSYFNYIINRLRFKNLRCGKNVVVNLCGKSQFSYGAGTWLAEGTRIDIFNSKVHLSEGVNICRYCYIAPDKSGIKIGKRSKLQEYGRLSGQITIGDDVIIAPNFYISSGVHVFNQEPHLLIALQDRKHDNFAGLCIIEDDCWIGMNVCVMPGVRIRRGCIIGAGAIVTRSTEPYAIYGGVPAKKIGVRLTLEPKTFLDANIPENIPYFYQGFDHFNYLKHKDKYQGIPTNATNFSLYTELPQVKTLHLQVEPLCASYCSIVHNHNTYEVKSGINDIKINGIEIVDKLINFQSTAKLIMRKIIFN